MKNYRRVLTIAGSDSGGGAGIQADLKTFSALGVYGMTVITALTAQNTQGVFGIFPVDPSFIEKQLDCVLADIGVDSVKIGMLHSAEVIEVVARALRKFAVPNIVLDPVMVAKGGAKLIEDEAVQALIQELFPLASLITPNLPEAEVLLKEKLEDRLSFKQALGKLKKMGSRAVLLKGGHAEEGQSTLCQDFLFYEGETFEFSSTRTHTKNTHGTGCTLSSAIAAGLAQGKNMYQAVSEGRNYLQQAIAQGSQYNLGQGHGPVHHFHQWWS